jgi:hypothetical protein
MKKAGTIGANVGAAIEAWASQKRGAYFNGGAWSASAILAQILNESVDERSQVGGIIRLLSPVSRATLTCHYVFRWPWKVTVEKQCEVLETSKSVYWERLRVAEYAVAVGLTLLDDQRAP